MHLFDPSTGENLTVDREHAGRIVGHAMEDAAEQEAAAG
jgi:multiple sugar transport system ATP-binding protein